MRRVQILLIAIGLAVVIVIVARLGVADVAAAFAAAGWGIALVTLSHLPPLAADAAGWRALLTDRPRPAPVPVYLIRWASESVNNLLPVAQLGGEVVRVRMIGTLGTSAPVAASSVIVDVTLGLITQILFALIGLAILFGLTGADGPTLAVGIGLVVFAAAIGGFFMAQRAGAIRHGGRLAAQIGERLLGRDLETMAGGAERLDSALHALYRQRPVLARCAAWRMASWFGQSLEIWLSLYVLGYPLGLGEAIVLQSLVAAVRSAAFVIPGALGAQEAGFLGLGVILGLPPEAALALALLRRAREVLLGLPGLGLWWFREARDAGPSRRM